MSDDFSEFIVYVDEAGDHGPISKEFPVFVLAFCVFKKHEYACGLERVERLRSDAGDTGTLHVVFEARGKREDEELELEFRRVCESNTTGKVLSFEPVSSKKAANHCGLQLADLMARPIGLHVMRPEQPNRSYDILATKFRRSPEEQIDGFGLKCYP